MKSHRLESSRSSPGLGAEKRRNSAAGDLAFEDLALQKATSFSEWMDDADRVETFSQSRNGSLGSIEENPPKRMT